MNVGRNLLTYIFHGSGWTKNRVWTGVTVPIAKHVSFQPSYMWEGTNGLKDVNYGNVWPDLQHEIRNSSAT
jgi:hypothetical protein